MKLVDFLVLIIFTAVSHCYNIPCLYLVLLRIDWHFLLIIGIACALVLAVLDTAMS